jgi:hypothetical protein
VPTIAILEDDARRSAAFREAAKDLQECDVLVFDSAPAMCEWLADNLTQVRLISLDCDLDATNILEGTCGSGEDVVEFLARQSLRIPMLIHSSNAMRGPAMHLQLATAGFPHVRLGPFRDASQWLADISKLIAAAS